MPECALNGHDVAPCRDQPGCVEVSKVMESPVTNASVLEGLAPPIADLVLIRWHSLTEKPFLATGHAGVRDVATDQLEQLVRERYDAFGPVLRESDLDQ